MTGRQLRRTICDRHHAGVEASFEAVWEVVWVLGARSLTEFERVLASRGDPCVLIEMLFEPEQVADASAELDRLSPVPESAAHPSSDLTES